MPLIKKIHDAVKGKCIKELFTKTDVENWIIRKGIVKDDGKTYKARSIKSILYNSVITDRPTKNRNIKVLRYKLINNIRWYYFV